MSTIHRAFNSARSIYYAAAAAGQVRVTDLVDGVISVGPRGQYVQESRSLGLIINGEVIAGPDDDPTDAHLRAVLAALLDYVPEATN